MPNVCPTVALRCGPAPVSMCEGEYLTALPLKLVLNYLTDNWRRLGKPPRPVVPVPAEFTVPRRGKASLRVKLRLVSLAPLRYPLATTKRGFAIQYTPSRN